MLQQRLEQVEDRLAKAASRTGRSRQDITLIAVTKKFPASVIVEAYTAGLRDFGENYVQEFEGKAPECSHLEGARFHLIGHLQSNKTAKAIELFQVIQTIDSTKLARRVAEQSAQPLQVMIEVKLSPEQAKSGTPPESLPELIDAIRQHPNLTLTGLMTMPPWSDDAERSRPYFIRLRQLAEQHKLAQLSMGMSHDLETAIEEGATMVRVGTGLFGPRPKA
ncbi:MAG: YggS family pyridoxal phosphate-dependent enzyme [Bryobacteraceae bacterium]